MKRIICCLLAMSCFCMMWTVPTVSAASVNNALLSYVAGDANGDWSLNTADVRVILSSIVNESPARTIADINFDSNVNTSDASAILRAIINNTPADFVQPTASEAESAPEGEIVEFSLGCDREKYSGAFQSKNNMWIAQSLDELKACYAHSYGIGDYSELYTEEFFEDKAVIVWDVYHMDDGLMRIEPNRIVKSGSELYFVKTLRYATEYLMPYAEYIRYILEISKDDLVGIESLHVCSEIAYGYGTDDSTSPV